MCGSEWLEWLDLTVTTGASSSQFTFVTRIVILCGMFRDTDIKYVIPLRNSCLSITFSRLPPKLLKIIAQFRSLLTQVSASLRTSPGGVAQRDGEGAPYY